MSIFWQRGTIDTNSTWCKGAHSVILNGHHSMTKANPRFIIQLTNKQATSHLSAIHNSKAGIPANRVINTGNAPPKRPAGRCRHCSSHLGFRRFHQRSACKLRDVGGSSAWKRNTLTVRGLRKHRDSLKSQRIWLFYEQAVLSDQLFYTLAFRLRWSSGPRSLLFFSASQLLSLSEHPVITHPHR